MNMSFASFTSQTLSPQKVSTFQRWNHLTQQPVPPPQRPSSPTTTPLQQQRQQYQQQYQHHYKHSYQQQQCQLQQYQLQQYQLQQHDQHQQHLNNNHQQVTYFTPVRRRTPVGGFDDRTHLSSILSAATSSNTGGGEGNHCSNTPTSNSGKLLNTTSETVYEKTIRILMTANQNVIPMEEEEEVANEVATGDEDEDDCTIGVDVGQTSILDFFGKQKNCMEEDNEADSDDDME